MPTELQDRIEFANALHLFGGGDIEAYEQNHCKISDALVKEIPDIESRPTAKFSAARAAHVINALKQWQELAPPDFALWRPACFKTQNRSRG